MSNTSITVTGAHCSNDGALYSAVVFHDGESFYSFIMSESAIGSDTNRTSTIYEQPVWFTDLWQSSSGALYVCDDDGQVHHNAGGSWVVEKATEQALTALWGFDDGTVYCAGIEGVVFKRSDGRWQSVSPPLGNTIQCIRGASPTDLYVCGEGSLFFHFDGKDWTRIELPTNAILVGLLVLSATDVIVCGGGVLYRGTLTEWADLSQPGRDFYKIVQFGGVIYIAGGSQGVFTFEAGAATNLKDNFPVYRVSANGNYLAAAGANSALRFDGSKWFKADYNG